MARRAQFHFHHRNVLSAGNDDILRPVTEVDVTVGWSTPSSPRRTAIDTGGVKSAGHGVGLFCGVRVDASFFAVDKGSTCSSAPASVAPILRGVRGVSSRTYRSEASVRSRSTRAVEIATASLEGSARSMWDRSNSMLAIPRRSARNAASTPDRSRNAARSMHSRAAGSTLWRRIASVSVVPSTTALFSYVAIRVPFAVHTRRRSPVLCGRASGRAAPRRAATRGATGHPEPQTRAAR